MSDCGRMVVVCHVQQDCSYARFVPCYSCCCFVLCDLLCLLIFFVCEKKGKQNFFIFVDDGPIVTCQWKDQGRVSSQPVGSWTLEETARYVTLLRRHHSSDDS